MGLFDKKNCDICNGKIGMLGNRKLDDGNLCKDCASKLSPFFSERRRSTVSDIQGQLAYREANKAQVAGLHITRSLGDKTKVLLDEDAGKFVVTSSGRWQSENPDVISFSQVTGCHTDIVENKTELKTKDKDGNQVSFTPPRYEFSYDFYVVIHVNSPWFTELRFQINKNRVSGRGSVDYREYEQMGNEIKAALTQVRQDTRDQVAQANAPKIARICPNCGATTTPDANGRCDYCGGAM